MVKIYKQNIKKNEDESETTENKDQEADQYHFNFKEPEPVSPVDEKEVIQYEGRKSKKKRFPWIPVIAGVIIVGVAIYFYLKKKEKKEIEFEIPEIEWVYIPAGEFKMGDNFNEGDSDEQPVHSVYLDVYHISKYEISVSQFDNFCKATGRVTLTDSNNLNTWWKQYAATYVSWEDVNDFCQWLSLGKQPPDCNKANYSGCGFGLTYVTSCSEGSIPTGIYNMAGNAWEWCQDWYSPLYYSQSPYQNPQGPSTGTNRAIRGGCFNSTEKEIRSANRDFKDPNGTFLTVGFRIVKKIN